MFEAIPRIQYGALPFRLRDGQAQIMLVTTRETGRWIIPKGWPKRGIKPHKLAAIEAYEEAGLIGRASKHPCGAFCYTKRLDGGDAVACEVLVYPLKVRHELAEWPEMGQRRRSWVDPVEAARLVQEPGLAELLRRTAFLPPSEPAPDPAAPRSPAAAPGGLVGQTGCGAIAMGRRDSDELP